MHRKISTKSSHEAEPDIKMVITRVLAAAAVKILPNVTLASHGL